MKTEKLEELFKHLEGEFDIESPKKNHTAGFLEKLNAVSKQPKIDKKTYTYLWKPILSIAASIVVIITITLGVRSNSSKNDLQYVSPEFAQTQHFFTTTIKDELNKLELEKTPEAKQLINDTMLHLNRLETDYENLKLALTESGDDKRIIHAMINNFQKRINLLQATLQKIETIKNLKNQFHENAI